MTGKDGKNGWRSHFPTVLGGIHALGMGIAFFIFLYQEWLWCKENAAGFFYWVFLGGLVSALKSFIWEVFVIAWLVD